MKIRVKHKETEFVIEDDGIRTDTNNNLIYFNKDYVIKLMEEITNNIVKIIKEDNK